MIRERLLNTFSTRSFPEKLLPYLVKNMKQNSAFWFKSGFVQQR